MIGMMGWEAPKQVWRKGPWTSEEDKLLTEHVNLNGEGRWSSVARSAGLNRSGKSCRLRWVNYLRPGLKRGRITPQEEGIIIELHALWGNKWSTIARYLPGRTDNEIKNYWRTHFKKKEKRSQEKRKAQILKLNKQQQQLEIKEKELPQPDKDHKTEAGTDEAQGKQEMIFMYPNLQDHQEAAASWIDQCLINEGLWSELWNQLDDLPGYCNKTAAAMQNQTTTYNSSFGGDASKLYTAGGYIF